MEKFESIVINSFVVTEITEKVKIIALMGQLLKCCIRSYNYFSISVFMNVDLKNCKCAGNKYRYIVLDVTQFGPSLATIHVSRRNNVTLPFHMSAERSY